MISHSIEATGSKSARFLHCGRQLSKRAAIALTVMMSLVGLSVAANDGFLPDTGNFPPDGIAAAGIACRLFPLKIEIRAALHRPEPKIFNDKNGNFVRFLSVGLGNDLRFTNVISGAQFTLQGSGSTLKLTPNPDGSLTAVSTGNNVIILYPTDVPAGPSTIQYVGEVVYTVTNGSVFTLLKVKGKQTDICAELSN